MIGAGVTRFERWVLAPLVWVFLVFPHETKMAVRRAHRARREMAAKEQAGENAPDSDLALAHCQAVPHDALCRAAVPGKERRRVMGYDERNSWEDHHQDPWWAHANADAGHSYTCAHAGGGDCTCPKGNVTAYVVTAVVGGRSTPIKLTEDESEAVRVARTARKVMRGVRLRRLRGHASTEQFLDMLAGIEEAIRKK